MATITFTPTTWVDDTTPAITAAQLNRLEAAVDDVINGGGDLDLGSNDLITGGELKTGNGSAAAPSYAFGSYTNKGLYSSAAGTVSLSIGGAEIFEWSATYQRGTATGSAQIMSAAGTVSVPAFTFRGDTDTGVYRVGANDIGIASGGALVFRADGSFTWLHKVYTDTSAQAANMYINSSGRVLRSTSALKYKAEVEPLDLRGAPMPTPVRYRSKIDGNMHYGFIADEVAELYPDAAVYNKAGEVEDYDAKALLALMVAGGVL